jgi:formate-dependent nitrite reductase cytochrome c552 subunit
MDANSNCIDCHGGSQLITAKLFQYSNSGHATGDTYLRNSSGCAVCHTSQGFLEVAGTQNMETAATVADPLPVNCYACHEIHRTYTAEDWALTQGDPVTFWYTQETIDNGTGNMCINCHQARVPDPLLPAVGETAMLEITNKRWGPHHGPQGQLFAGVGGYEFGGSYENSAHTNLLENGCVTCHMGPAVGNLAGGHQMGMDDEGDLLTTGCNECHDDGIDAIVEEKQAEIVMLMDELRVLLFDQGLIDDEDYVAVPATLNEVQAGAIFNFKFLEEDQSHGIHNYRYAKKLLEESISAIE